MVSPSPNRVFAVVPAAGVGTRMGASIPKQYLDLNGRTVIAHTLERLAEHQAIESVVVAIAADDVRFADLARTLPDKCVAVVGGAERYQSVLAGLHHLAAIAAPDDWVLVHDAARPCVRRADIERLLHELADSAVGGILSVPVRDTLKRSGVGHTVSATIDRSALWHALTPQMFRFGLLTAALESVQMERAVVTDEAEAVERHGYCPQLVTGHSDNIKITHAEDLSLAALILTAQGRS
jgi:2-C-methyl-D-erythritol 4-phosphate cytidylyltransferase